MALDAEGGGWLRGYQAPFHHGSHHVLLTEVSTANAPTASVDAVIVPAGRPTHWLSEAGDLARRLGCVLVALCSKRASAAAVADLASVLSVRTVAIDIDSAMHVPSGMATSQLLADSSLLRKSDTSTKRNLALLLCRLAGWERVLFLDDDIVDIDMQDAEAAAGLLKIDSEDTGFNAVGIRNCGYPDNSVVCHIYRQLGGPQAQFIGGGGLAVAPLRTTSFFPDVYNEDWLFLLGDTEPTAIAITGAMKQRTYDPFADSMRAGEEEFGDCIGEGLFWLLDQQLSLANADVQHWRNFLLRRQQFIEFLECNAKAEVWGSNQWTRPLSSLKAARSALAKITPSMCADYVKCWHRDLSAWRRFIADVPTRVGLNQAIAWLGIAKATHLT